MLCLDVSPGEGGWGRGEVGADGAVRRSGPSLLYEAARPGGRMRSLTLALSPELVHRHFHSMPTGGALSCPVLSVPVS